MLSVEVLSRSNFFITLQSFKNYRIVVGRLLCFTENIKSYCFNINVFVYE